VVAARVVVARIEGALGLGIVTHAEPRLAVLGLGMMEGQVAVLALA
jgi:hypothetical protein